MNNGSVRQRAALWALLFAALPAAVQSQPASAECYAYKLDTATNRIIFNDPRPIVLMPDKKERKRLRSQGTPGQIFKMKDCDAPNFTGRVTVYPTPETSGEGQQIPSATRVVILEQRDKWYKVKGYTSLWKGSGWVKQGENKVLVVEFTQ